MKPLIAAVLCVLLPLTALGSNGFKVTYDGGSVADMKSGSSMRLSIGSNQIRLAKGEAELATVPASAITEISYGQDVHRRVGTAGEFAHLNWPTSLI
jgi:hypothetical protein